MSNVHHSPWYGSCGMSFPSTFCVICNKQNLFRHWTSISAPPALPSQHSQILGSIIFLNNSMAQATLHFRMAFSRNWMEKVTMTASGWTMWIIQAQRRSPILKQKSSPQYVYVHSPHSFQISTPQASQRQLFFPRTAPVSAKRRMSTADEDSEFDTQPKKQCIE